MHLLYYITNILLVYTNGNIKALGFTKALSITRALVLF